MSFTLRCTALLIVAIVGVAGLGWTTPLHLHVGGVAGGITLLIAVGLLWVSRDKGTDRGPFRENPLREALLGTFTGGGWIGLMLLFFFVVARLPGGHAFFLDQDRASVLKAAGLLETNGNYQEAADIYLDTLKSPHSAEWTHDLATGVVKDLTLAAEQSPKEAATLLREALRVAKQYGISADFPRSVMKALAERNAQSVLEGDVAAAEDRLRNVDASLQKAERQLEVQQRQAADALHKAFSTRLQSVCSVTRATLADNLLGLGQLLESEVRVAADNRVPTADAAKLLGEVRAQIAAQQPRDLPTGARARVLRVVPSAMPGLLVVDVQATDASGANLDALRSVDFVARQNGRPCSLAAAPLAGGGTVDLAVALDRSDSMQGEKLRAMKAACVDMLQRLPSGVRVRVSTFGSDVRTVADWSTQRDAAVESCQWLQADGATALFAAIADALSAFVDRSASGQVVVFSDGANSVPGPSRESLIAESRRCRAAIHFIALTSGHDDLTDIKAIAAATGGRVLEVGDASELTASFRQMADEVTATGYRVAILDVASSQPTEIRIGRLNAVQLTVPAQNANQPVATQ